MGAVVNKNLANVVSILGVLPICIFFRDNGYQFLIPLMIYNNIMDDLDGILAARLKIKSEFGAILDNVCDAVVHTVFVMVVGMHFGGVCATAGLVATAAILVRVVTRLDPAFVKSATGSPTNELIRHVLFILLLTQSLASDPTPFLSAAFALHSVSMLAPFSMPHMIRARSKSAAAIILVNVALVAAWLTPYAAGVIAASFVVTYLYSFATGAIRWLNTNSRVQPEMRRTADEPR